MGLFSAIGNFFSTIGDIAKVVAPIAAFIPGAQGIAVVAAAVSKIAPVAGDAISGIENSNGRVTADGISSAIQTAASITNDSSIYLRDTNTPRIAPA